MIEIKNEVETAMKNTVIEIEELVLQIAKQFGYESKIPYPNKIEVLNFVSQKINNRKFRRRKISIEYLYNVRNKFAHKRKFYLTKDECNEFVASYEKARGYLKSKLQKILSEKRIQNENIELKSQEIKSKNFKDFVTELFAW